MERDPFDRDQGGSDVGRDLERDFGDEPPAAIRDAAPDKYRWSSIVLGIVKSSPFRRRRSES